MAVPRQGDFLTMEFNPQSGHEQWGRRPALVVSNDAFNRATGMAMVCPLTNTDRRNPFHVPVSGRTKLSGFVMVDQVKSLDPRARRAKRIGRAPADLLEEVQGILEACLR